MKIKLLTLALPFAAASAFAAPATTDMTDLARLLINNPSVAAQLKPQCADRLQSFEAHRLDEGVREFKLAFTQSGMCVPVNAFFTIREDMRPTAMDGAPDYEVTLDIKPRD